MGFDKITTKTANYDKDKIIDYRLWQFLEFASSLIGNFRSFFF